MGVRGAPDSEDVKGKPPDRVIGGGSLQRKEGSRWGGGRPPARGAGFGWKERGPPEVGTQLGQLGCMLWGADWRVAVPTERPRPGQGRVRAPGPLSRPPKLVGPGSPPLLRACLGARLRPRVTLGRRERPEPAEPPQPPPPPPPPPCLAPFDTHTPTNMAAGRGRAGCVRAPAGPAPPPRRGPAPAEAPPPRPPPHIPTTPRRVPSARAVPHDLPPNPSSIPSQTPHTHVDDPPPTAHRLWQIPT